MSRPHHHNWMSVLPDDLLISEINIPGSHNAAAINTVSPTRWACQDQPITAQLSAGIRLLDIRLKPQKRQGKYIFITCHGRLGLLGANEFQPFDELLLECTAFLRANPGETIVMTLKIDDWRRTRASSHATILQTLKARLNLLPIVNAPHLPTLGECRGNIYLINRINADPALGVPLDIPDNMPGATLTPTMQRRYPVYVQDRYKGLDPRNPEAHKLRLTIAAINSKRPGAVLLNFASATKPLGRFVYIMRELLDYFSGTPGGGIPPKGWLFLDYALTTDLPALIIASNFP